VKLIERKNVLLCAGFLTVLSVRLVTGIGELSAFSILSSTLLLALGYVAMVFDIITKRIPNKLVISMIAGWLLLMVTVVILNIENAVVLLTDSLFGFLTGGGLFLLVYVISRKGLGGGDVKFMAAAGLYLGFAGTIPAILYGTVLAALTGLVLICLKKIGRKDTMPLVPFLFIGIMITVFTK